MSVYFVKDHTGAVKIGLAKNVDKRIAALQTAHAYNLDLIRVIPGGALEEWACHFEFRSQRIRGEWFTFSEPMMTFEPSGLSRITLLRSASKMEVGPREYRAVDSVRAAVIASPMKQKDIARLMGMRPSDLSRKLSQNPDDSRRFTLDDLERFVEVTGDTQPIYYLVEKYLADNTDRISQLEAELARLRKSA